MKKMICLCFAAMLMMGAACAESLGSRTGFEVLRMLYDGEENCVVSPLSLTYALSMLAEGAQGETQQEILRVLAAEDTESVKALEKTLSESGLRLANAAFWGGETEVNGEYVEVLNADYGAEWFSPEESTLEKINEWAAEQTQGMIEGLLQELPKQVQLVLVNALAMDAVWSVPFDPSDTEVQIFHAPSEDVSVSMMHREMYASYAEREQVQLLRLRYREGGLSMLIALPEAGEIQRVLDGLCEEGLDYFSFEDQSARVALSMPKVDVTAENQLKDALCQLGMRAAFSETADFSGIWADGTLSVSDVVQKVRLTLDEEGTRAAAATAVMIAESAQIQPEEIVQFKMDRPFAVIIVHEASETVCFAGIVTNPSGN